MTKTTVITVAALLWICHPALAFEQTSPRYELLLKGGHVIDPANGINEPCDVAVQEGKIAAVAPRIEPSDARRVVEVNGLYVTPGIIDLHAHCVVGGDGKWGFPPDMYLASGVTTVVDAGTYGAKNFTQLRHYVMERSKVRVLAFLNIVAAGMGDKEQDVGEMNPQLCAATIAQYPDLLVGVKTAHYWTYQPPDEKHPLWAAVDRAVEAGRLANVPVMVDFWPRPPQRSYADLILKKLRPGDIHTHVFAQQFPIVGPDGKLNPNLGEARKRGVLFDLGHGAGSFWFRNAVPALQQGFLPDTISTDLHRGNVNGPVLDMATTMSKFLAMGVSLEDVIRRCTANPARLLRHPDLGTLSIGQQADVAVFELRNGRFGYVDCGQAKIVGDVKLENRLTVRAGRIEYDPFGLSRVVWDQAPAQYFSTPKLQYVDPPAYADPDRLKDWLVRRQNRLKP